jgi:hypothetical protein
LTAIIIIAAFFNIARDDIDIIAQAASPSAAGASQGRADQTATHCADRLTAAHNCKRRRRTRRLRRLAQRAGDRQRAGAVAAGAAKDELPAAPENACSVRSLAEHAFDASASCLGAYQSLVHSQTLPIMSCRP